MPFNTVDPGDVSVTDRCGCEAYADGHVDFCTAHRAEHRRLEEAQDRFWTHVLNLKEDARQAHLLQTDLVGGTV